MPSPQAYRNGELLPAEQLRVPVYDTGFVMGTTVTEQLRTFGGKLFRLDDHLQRFEQSLQLAGFAPTCSMADIAEMAHDLAGRNHQLLDSADDLGLCIFATPGAYPAMAPADAEGPLLAVHTYPLPFRLFADKYQTGQRLIVADVPQISPQAIPPSLKCRSRMHYWLADTQARAADPHARAIMLDEQGFVLEATTANILVYRKDEGLITPPSENILPGISVLTTCELAEQLGIALIERDLSVDDVQTADEVMLTSTSMCIQPATSLNSLPIGSGQPGPILKQLVAVWQQRVGVDFVAQADKFALRVHSG